MKDLFYVKNFRINLVYKEKTEILSLGERGDEVWAVGGSLWMQCYE